MNLEKGRHRSEEISADDDDKQPAWQSTRNGHRQQLAVH